MPTSPEACANHRINLEMCPCTNKDCANRGICCECMQAHVGYGNATACMRTARTTVTFSIEPIKTCATNGARNADFCVCSNTSCPRRGVCCNCVRNHWNAEGTGRTACMKNQ
jgi:hypothetical protein